MKKILAFGVVLSTLSTSLTAAPTDSEIKEHLDLTLSNIASQAQTSRYVAGGVSIALAGLLGIGAGVASGSDDPNLKASLPVLFGVSAGLFGILGILQFSIPTQQETLSRKYLALPEKTPEEIHSKIAKGDGAVVRLKNVSRRQRLLSAGTLLVFGGAQTVLYFASTDRSSNSFLIYYGVLLGGVGLIRLFVESATETEAHEYLDWRGSKTDVSFQWNIAPVPNGAALFASLRF